MHSRAPVGCTLPSTIALSPGCLMHVAHPPVALRPPQECCNCSLADMMDKGLHFADAGRKNLDVELVGAEDAHSLALASHDSLHDTRTAHGMPCKMSTVC